MTTKIVDIADEIYREMGEPSDSSIASIAFWLRTNISRLNILINKPYTINEETLEISDTETDPFGINEKGIFKLIYTSYYYERLFRNALGAASTDSVIEIDQNGFRAKKVNKNELAKTYSDLKKQTDEQLKMMLDNYNINEVTPIQVAGDDTIEAPSRTYSYSRNIESL